MHMNAAEETAHEGDRAAEQIADVRHGRGADLLQGCAHGVDAERRAALCAAATGCPLRSWWDGARCHCWADPEWYRRAGVADHGRWFCERSTGCCQQCRIRCCCGGDPRARRSVLAAGLGGGQLREIPGRRVSRTFGCSHFLLRARKAQVCHEMATGECGLTCCKCRAGKSCCMAAAFTGYAATCASADKPGCKALSFNFCVRPMSLTWWKHMQFWESTPRACSPGAACRADAGSCRGARWPERSRPRSRSAPCAAGA